MDARSVRNMWSIFAVTNKHTAKLHHVGSLYILTYDARKLKHKMPRIFLTFGTTRVVGHQPYALAAFTSEEIPYTHF